MNDLEQMISQNTLVFLLLTFNKKMPIRSFYFLFVFCIYWLFTYLYIRSSRPKVFCKKGVLRNFEKFTRKHLCQSLLFNKVAGLRPTTLLKKETLARCFPGDFCEIFLRATFLKEHLRSLLLTYQKLYYKWFFNFYGNFLWKCCMFTFMSLFIVSL